MTDDELLKRLDGYVSFSEETEHHGYAVTIDNRIVKKATARIRDQRDLLDECEKALEDIMHWTENTHATANQIAIETLDKLRGEKV